MNLQTFWNEVGSKKVFEDPFPLEKVESMLEKGAKIVEYGCGYGLIHIPIQELVFDCVDYLPEFPPLFVPCL